MPETSRTRGKRESPACGSTALRLGGVVRTPNSSGLMGDGPEARLISRFGISKEQEAYASPGIGWATPRWRSCFPPTPPHPAENGPGFSEERLPRPPARGPMARSCSRPRVCRPAGPSQSPGRANPSAGRFRDSPALFLGGARPVGVALPTIRLQDAKLTTPPLDTDPLQGWNTKLARGDKMHHQISR